MAVPVVASSATSSSASFGTSHVVTMPSGVQSDDLLVCKMATDGITGNYTAPSGWTEDHETQESNITGALFYKLSDGTEGASETWTYSQSKTFNAVCVRITGVDTTTPVAVTGVSSGTGGSGVGSCPAVTDSTTDRLTIRTTAFQAYTAAPASPPAAVTVRASNDQTSGVSTHIDVATDDNNSIEQLSWNNDAYGSWIHDTLVVAPGSSLQTIEPSGIASTAAIGSPTLSASNTIAPTGIGSTVAFGSPTVSPGTASILPDGIASTLVIPTPSANLIQRIDPTGIASTLAFGAPTVGERFVISPTGLANAVGFGAVGDPLGLLYPISVSGIASTVTFTPPLVEPEGGITATGIASTVAFGTPAITGGLVDILPTGIPSSVAFGTLSMATTYGIDVSGIASTLAFGTAIAADTSLQLILATGIAPTLAFGSVESPPTVLSGISVLGILPTCRIGNPIVWNTTSNSGGTVMTPATATDFLEASSTTFTRRVDIYESDNSQIWMHDVGVASGGVSIDQTRSERRSGDLTLYDEDGSLVPEPGGLWYDKVFRVYLGIEDPATGDTREWLIATFLADNITRENDSNLVKLSVRDFSKKMSQSKLSAATGFAVNTPVESIIDTLAGSAGVALRNLPFTGAYIAEDIFFDGDTDRWSACYDLATSHGYDLFFTANGTLVMEPFADPYTDAPVIEFRTGASGNLASIKRSINDTRIRNHIVVIGEALDKSPVWGEAVNEEPTSPTNVTDLGYRTERTVSSYITTFEQAQALADSILNTSALESFDVDLGMLIYPNLEVNKTATIIDPEAAVGDPTEYLISSLNIDLGLGPMTGNFRRVTLVG